MDDPENSAEYAAMDFNTASSATTAATGAATGASRNTAIPIPRGSVGTGPSGVHHGWMSSPSSGSFLSGTPNSNSEAATELTLGHRNVISYLRPDDDPPDNDNAATELAKPHPPLKPYPVTPATAAAAIAAAAAAANKPPISTSSNSSGRSRTSSLTKFIEMPLGSSSRSKGLSPSPFGRTPPAAPHTTPLGQSPAANAASSAAGAGGPPPTTSGLTALAGWFRSRAGSVPSRPSLSSRRRHRTHSEGEKDSQDNQEATEAALAAAAAKDEFEVDEDAIDDAAVAEAIARAADN